MRGNTTISKKRWTPSESGNIEREEICQLRTTYQKKSEVSEFARMKIFPPLHMSSP
jgi:hypothetical protein